MASVTAEGRGFDSALETLFEPIMWYRLSQWQCDMSSFVSYLVTAVIGCLLQSSSAIHQGDLNMSFIPLSCTFLPILLPFETDHVEYKPQNISKYYKKLYPSSILIVKMLMTDICTDDTSTFMHTSKCYIWIKTKEAPTCQFSTYKDARLSPSNLISDTYWTLPVKSVSCSTEETDCSSGLTWQDLSSLGSSWSVKTLIGVQAMVSLRTRALCLQGAPVNEPPSTPEACRLSLRGATGISCLSVPSILSWIPASPQPPPFCSWLKGASSLLLSVMLHSGPPERLFFRIPLKPGSDSQRGKLCWVGLGSTGSEPVSGLGWERRTSLGFRLTDEACCLSDRWGDKQNAGSCTGPFWSWTETQFKIIIKKVWFTLFEFSCNVCHKYRLTWLCRLSSSTHQVDLLHSDGLCTVSSPLLPPSLRGSFGIAVPLPPRQRQFVEEGQLLTHAQLAVLITVLCWVSLLSLGLHWWCWVWGAAGKQTHMI